MNPPQRLWTLAAIVHFSLVLCGAAQVGLTGDSPVVKLLGQYSNVSGADNNYSFFAPAVSSLCRCTLTLRDGQEREWPGALFDDPATVFGWRAAGIFDGLPGFSDRFRRALAASWAGLMFGRYPDAREVIVCVEIEALPTMAEWRAGKRPQWKSVYQGTFVRKDEGDEPRGRE
jgi:hypothetical protein